MGCQVRAAGEVRAACFTSTTTELIAAASDSSSPTTARSQRGQRMSSCTSGAVTSAGPTVAQLQLVSSTTARSRCVTVQQFETRLTGLVLAAAQGDRLRLDHRPRIRQVRSQNKPAYNLCNIMISEVSPRFDDPCNSLYQMSIHDSLLEIFHKPEE